MRPIMINLPAPIETPRLILRQPIAGYVDAQEFSNTLLESYAEFTPWLPWVQYYPTAEQAEEYIRESCANWIIKTNNNVGIPFFVIEKATGRFLGCSMLHNIDWQAPRFFEIGYWLRTSATGHGFMTETENALVRYCFLQLNARRVEIRSEIANTRSQEIPQRLGFKFDGILKNNQFAARNGLVTDTVVFSRTNLDGMPNLEVSWPRG